MLITLIVLGFKILPLGISLDGDLGVLNSNVLSFITFVYFKSVPLAKHQSIVVASGPYKTSVTRKVARAPAFIQLEHEDKLTGVERVAGFRFNQKSK